MRRIGKSGKNATNKSQFDRKKLNVERSISLNKNGEHVTIDTVASQPEKRKKLNNSHINDQQQVLNQVLLGNCFAAGKTQAIVDSIEDSHHDHDTRHSRGKINLSKVEASKVTDKG